MSLRRSRSFRKLKGTGEASNHHHVYVVELKSEVAELPSVKRTNRKRNPELPCVYVGMTGLAPEERLQKHLNGIKSSYYVKNYGLRLLPDLYDYLNPMPYEAAVTMEADLAEDLRAQGYTVTGGH